MLEPFNHLLPNRDLLLGLKVVAPTIKFFCLIVPAGSSSTEYAFFTGFMKRQGCKFSISFTIFPFLLMNNTSIEKFIKHVWIELQGMIQSPSPIKGFFRNIRPFNLLENVSAFVIVYDSICISISIIYQHLSSFSTYTTNLIQKQHVLNIEFCRTKIFFI